METEDLLVQRELFFSLPLNFTHRLKLDVLRERGFDYRDVGLWYAVMHDLGKQSRVFGEFKTTVRKFVKECGGTPVPADDVANAQLWRAFHSVELVNLRGEPEACDDFGVPAVFTVVVLDMHDTNTPRKQRAAKTDAQRQEDRRKRQLAKFREDFNQPVADSYVYVIADDAEQLVKVGVSANPASRLDKLSQERKRKLRLLAAMPGDRDAEQNLHELLAAHRVTGEWFQMTSDTSALLHRVTSGHTPGHGSRGKERKGKEQTNTTPSRAHVREDGPTGTNPDDTNSRLSKARRKLGSLAYLVDELEAIMARERGVVSVPRTLALSALWHPISLMMPAFDRDDLRAGLDAAIAGSAPNAKYVRKSAETAEQKRLNHASKPARQRRTSNTPAASGKYAHLADSED